MKIAKFNKDILDIMNEKSRKILGSLLKDSITASSRHLQVKMMPRRLKSNVRRLPTFQMMRRH